MPKKGYKQTPEQRARTSAVMVGNKNAKGHIESLETREKKAAANRGFKQSKERKEKIRGDKNGSWKGGRTRRGSGNYIAILCPDHPFADHIGYVMEHRLVMEAHLGRTLLPSEVVHHIDGIRDDNRIENLMLFSSRGKHTSYHAKVRKGKNT